MRGILYIFVIVVFRALVEAESDDVAILSELPFGELLARKKVLDSGNVTLSREEPLALGLMGEPSDVDMTFKHLHRQPSRKTFHDYDHEDEKHHKKEKHKGHDLLNTSITALSYLAFGGYLLCMIANALREKRRRVTMTYPTAAQTVNNHFSAAFQNLAHRPHRPFIRFPAVTVHQGKKRRRRSTPPLAEGHH